MGSRAGACAPLRVALFGPQRTQWTRENIADLQSALENDTRLAFIRDALDTLPSLSELLQEADRRHDHFYQSNVKLQTLRAIASGSTGSQDACQIQPQNFSNVELAPLTVVSQVIDLVHQYGGSSIDKFEETQGFCLGFLSAASFAAASSWRDFEQNVANAIRLATCIGWIVDADQCSHPASAVSVRCKTPSDRAHLDVVLDSYSDAYISCITDEKNFTVTIPQDSEATFFSCMKEADIATTSIGLRGSYHSRQKYAAAAERLSRICAANAGILQLPGAHKLRLPLRSTATTECLTAGALHDIAIELILCQRAFWFQTVKKTLGEYTPEQTYFVALGSDACIPRSLGRSLWTNVPDETDRGFEEIAVVGMSCRFPRSENLEEFWQLLNDGGTALGTIPHERYDPAQIQRSPKLPSFWGNFLSSPDVFDHKFFGISGREAKSLDPQQRLALQVSYEALASSGYFSRNSGLVQKDVGVYMGVGAVEYQENIAARDANAFSATGTLRAFITGRISHFFGWEGPSMTIDTACSSSAVAIHTACKALLGGECSMALAGGVNVITSPSLHQNLAAASFLNLNGSSRAFDDKARGYCRGEGAGIIVLKRLSQALVDGDQVLGVIAASAVKQGSNCCPITVPHSQSQSTLYKQVLATARIKPEDVTYVEAHGTGTQVGDPIEYESIRSAFSSPSRKQELFLGSVKDNIGHTEGASGAAGVVKALLMMQHGMIPKQASFISLNRKIKASPEDRMTVPTETVPWKTPSRIALVNNYGAAGSNAAIVLREFSEKPTSQDRHTILVPSGHHPILLAAKTAVSLEAYVSALRSFLSRKRPSLASVAYDLAQNHDISFKYRISFVASDLEGAITELHSSTVGGNPGPKPVVLCFGGQTGRTVTISKELYERCDLLNKHLDECNHVCQKIGLSSILPGIFQTEPVDDLVSLHCRLLALQVASARTWLDSGLEVDTLVGHSFGQITALCVAGSISLEDTFRFVAGRARLFRDKWGTETGSMLAIECEMANVEKVLQLVNAIKGLRLDVACYNGPRSFVVAGNAASIAKALELCKDFRATKLKNSHAFHSHLTEGILADLHEISKSITIQQPRLRVETCSSKQSWTTISAEAIVQHTRQAVHFHDAVTRIAERLPSATWVEAGSATPVVPMVRRALTQTTRSDDIFLPLQLGTPEALSNLAKSAAELWKSGSSAQYWLFHRSSAPQYQRLNLPPYQFEKNSHWLSYEPPIPTTAVSHASELVTMIKDGHVTGGYEFMVDTASELFQVAARGHAVTGQSLCPASMYMEVVARAASIIANHVDATQWLPHIEDLTMLAPLGVGDSATVIIRLQKQHEAGESWAFTLSSHTSSGKSMDGTETQHASGVFNWKRADDVATQKRFQLLSRLGATRTLSSSMAGGVSGSMVYKLFSDVVEYASYYRGVQSISAADNEAIGKVRVPVERPSRLEAGICDPIILDNFLQVSGIHTNCLSFRGDDVVLMCTAIEEIIFSAAFVADRSDGREWVVYTRFESDAPANTRNHDLFVRDAKSGDLVLALLGAKFRGVAFKSLAKSLARLNRMVGTAANNLQIVDKTEDSGYSSMSDGIEGGEKPPSEYITEESVAETAQVPIDNSEEVMSKVRKMFSEIIEIPVEEVVPTSSLEDLGIDSLLVTEVLAEIHARFGFRVNQGQFSECADVRAVAALVGSVDTTIRSSLKTTPAKTNEGNPIRWKVSRQLPATLEVITPVQETNLAVAAREAFKTASSSYDAHADTTGFTGFYNEVCPFQSDLVVQYVVTAFASLGCDLRTLTPGSRIPAIQALPRHEKLMAQLYNILATAGLIAMTDRIFQRTAQSIAEVPSSVLHERILQRFPKHASETKLLHVTAGRLAECLSGTADPVSLLFGDAATRALLGDVYLNAPMFKTGTVLLTEYLSSLLAGIGNKRELRILELGAGTGGTTKFVVNALAQLRPGVKFTYTFTDLSSSLVATARRTFKNWDFMEYKVVDVEKEPPAEMLSAWDIILSTNCIHATRDLVRSTTHIRQMLKPDGLLCLVELTRNLFWFDLVFGLLEGWWLFTDGRTHALATEQRWKANLQEAGFRWVDWSRSATRESELLRVITASPCEMPDVPQQPEHKNELRQTIPFKEVDGQKLYADVYFSRKVVEAGTKLPVALMIHGGGHIMLSRNDIRPDQTEILLDSGFLPISIDYRLCPEVTLLKGPMEDVSDALNWIRNTLPSIPLARSDIAIDPTKVVAVGWSTGGHLATTLAWTANSPPDAILAFYCPLDYQDEFWIRPNIPEGANSVELDEQIWAKGLFGTPITSYNLPAEKRALGGWMAESDARSRLALYMNTQGRTLQVLLNGLNKTARERPGASLPSEADIVAVSPLAQARVGRYKTPTFLVHPQADDLIPWQQAERMYEAVREQGLRAELRLLKGDGVKHLFDMGGLRKVKDEEARQSVLDGYAFLCRHVGLCLKARRFE